MKKFIVLLIISSLTGQLAYSDCPAPVTLMAQGQTASCPGYLFTLSETAILTKMKQDYTILVAESNIKDKQLNDYSNEVSDLKTAIVDLNTKSNLWETKSNDYSSKYESLEKDTEKKDLLFIGLGALVTVAAGWALGQVHH